MRSLEQALLFFACGELTTFRARRLSFLVSGADVPGEGEIKLLGALHMLARCSIPSRGNLLLAALITDTADIAMALRRPIRSISLAHGIVAGFHPARRL